MGENKLQAVQDFIRQSCVSVIGCLSLVRNGVAVWL